MMTPLTPLENYNKLKKVFMKDVKGSTNQRVFGECFRSSLEYVSTLRREPLYSLVPGKSYFAFADSKGKLSRAVNVALFGSKFSEWKAFQKALDRNDLKGFDSRRITRLIYTAAMSFCCHVDLLHVGDQKTPGTFFEYLIAHLFAWRLNVNPERSIQVLNLDMKTSLPTDFIFNLGPEKPKFHLPVKTSTRERVIQVWAHQRVLDGVFGTARFLGTPVILTETKTGKAKKAVTEICLPDQWRIYQLHVAQLKRIYYLDMPVAYLKLNDAFPPLHVRPFGDFFSEYATLSV